MVKRIGMVASRSCWVADAGAVLLGNVIGGFHGGAVLLGNLIEVVLGRGWWRCACKSHGNGVSRWVWVVDLRLCARGKCMHHRIVNVV